MSFQGDVGGIGLAELLQSLARGRREGVLNLTSEEGVRCTLGVQNGLLHLLPDLGEDGRIWKERARRAWARDPDLRADALRTTEIARAHRIERVYQLLDSDGVHFRFENRPIPTPEDAADQPLRTSDDPRPVDAPRQTQVSCEGVAVEFLLLEYARLQDEFTAHSDGLDLEDHHVPRLLDPRMAPHVPPSMFEQCDGCSNLVEIADRLAWPIRQARLSVGEAMQYGAMRLAYPEELLGLALEEAEAGRMTRAASRYTAWIESSPPGPLLEEEAHLIELEWREGRLSPLLNQISTRDARRLLRRLEAAVDDQETAVRHWRELNRLRPSDEITELHRIAVESRWDTEEEDVPKVRELVDVARRFREEDQVQRAGALLRLAAEREPRGAAMCLEIGVGLAEAGEVEEGAPWVVDTARRLIEAGTPEKAIQPLRALLAVAPGLREARRLQSRARNMTVRRQIIRKHSVVGLAILVMLSVGAWVQIHFERQRDEKLAEIAALLNDPVEAQERFQRHFEGDESDRVRALAEAIDSRRREEEAQLRNAWYESYRGAQLECSLGEPVIGLRRALEIPNPPFLVTVDDQWPLVTDLFNGLAARLRKELDELGEPRIDDPDQVRGEARLKSLAEDLLAVLQEGERQPAVQARDLEASLVAIGEELRERGVRREVEQRERDRMDLMQRQELMLSAARAHKEAGDLERSLAVYERLVESDPSGKLVNILAEEIGIVRGQYEISQEALRLARSGEHGEAAALMDERLERPEALTLPWKLETFPPGALVHMPDGEVRRTPLQLETRLADRFEIRVELDGHATERIEIDGPADHFVWLSQLPELGWPTTGRVEALPVPTGQDHILCDRSGQIVRLSQRSRRVWEKQVRSLGGIARAPVFLSDRPGHLLLLTEDGEAWILDSDSGELEGPWSCGSPPVEGPLVTPEGVAARLRDGRRMLWTTRLKPEEFEPQIATGSEEPGEVASPHSVNSGMAVLRSPAGGRRFLDSPWIEWTVEITSAVYRIRPKASETEGFAVQRRGAWTFLAWEAPHARLPKGRLWIADGAGLHSYVP